MSYHNVVISWTEAYDADPAYYMLAMYDGLAPEPIDFITVVDTAPGDSEIPDFSAALRDLRAQCNVPDGEYLEIEYDL